MDRECKRRSHPMEIAQELDIDYLGSDYQFFDAKTLDRIEKEYVREPYRRGELDYNVQTLEMCSFIDRVDGQLLLWTNIDMQESSTVRP